MAAAMLMVSIVVCVSCDVGKPNEQLTVEQVEQKMRSFLLKPSAYRAQAQIRNELVKDGWCADKDLKLTKIYDARPVRTWIEFRAECAASTPVFAQFHWGDGTESYYVGPPR